MIRPDCGRPGLSATFRRRLLALLAVAALAGCASGPRATNNNLNSGPERAPQITVPPGLSPQDAVEYRYVIGPEVARLIDYRIDWQHPGSGYQVTKLAVEGDSVIALDTRNAVTRLRRADGGRIWTVVVVPAIEAVYGVTYLPETERVALMLGSEIILLDSATGSLQDKHRLSKPSNTAPVVAGPYLVYGSRSGQLVWHAHQIDTDWRAYKVASNINVTPIAAGPFIIATGSEGRVMNVLASTASQVWTHVALDDVVTPPAVGAGAVYVASTDQHVRAYAINEARTPLWEYLTQSALTSSPVYVDDRVYQAVPGHGLLCLEARPRNDPGGVVVWTSAEARGSVVVRNGGYLILWDDETKQLSVVEELRGAVVETRSMPQIDRLFALNPDGGNLWAIGVDGRIERLIAR